MAYRAVEARTMGDLVVLDVASGKKRTLTNVNPELEELCARRAEADQLEVIRRDGNLGAVADAARLRRQDADSAPRLLPRRSDWRRHARHLSAVHARARADRSVSDRGDGERRIRGALSHAAGWLGIRRGRPPHDHQRLGRARLQGHHGRRRPRDRARHCRSGSPGRDGRVVRRLHDQLDRHPDLSLQGRVGRRQHQRPQPISTT